jgi:mycofactocin precursor
VSAQRERALFALKGRRAMADMETQTVDDEVLVEELLVEEVSIDGMCGVY